MAYYDTRASFGLPRLTPWVKRLLIANGVVFFLSFVIGQNLVFRWFAFIPSEVLFQPWGAITYMFLHGDFMHLLVNMLVLFFFGPSLESRWGSSEFIRFYLVCGLGGVALSFVFAPGSMIVGASAAIYGLMLAFALNWPDAPIYIWGIFPVKAKWLVAFLFLTSVLSAFGGAGGGIAHFAHLGGIVTGFIYLKSDRGRAGSIGDRFREATRRARRLAIVPDDGQESDEETAGQSSPSGPRRPMRDEAALLDEVDRILDKISAEGMGALTEKERRVLDEVSRRRRTN